ncbi:Putative glutamine amidotransferase [Caminicella sporogenes DSM 14501]|uniref:Putative glutamine amidotransferase n=1 Tax=Caminicella sporogenes DSM 14501 TaxID=1121266 RepID=A0A1M6PE27_9FIRM|nr:VWA domain-containing protein [Caminicella sporogenes]RKD21433.1 hypothetical protein BET04_08320 [Caminicella sporogenes]SHK06213.1 Putative glutamine amidotransferase [Caminicella sporogenes DSM 14501]
MAIDSEINIINIFICFCIVVYFLIQFNRHFNTFSKKKFVMWICIRLTIIACLICAFFNVKWIATPHYTTTVFLVDMSLSAEEHKKEIEDYINRQLLKKKARDKIAVITFGKEPMIEVPISKDIKEVRLETKPNPLFTNIEEALSFTADYFPLNTNKRIVLFTDGYENMGNVYEEVLKLKSQNINLYIYPLKNKLNADFQITAINMPHYVYRGARVSAEVVIDATSDGEGLFRLYSSGNKIIEKHIKVQRGKNTFLFKVLMQDVGNIKYTGEIEFKEDTNPENNFINVSTMVIDDKPNVLIVGNREDAKNVENLLDSLHIHKECYTPSRVPSSIDFLSGFQEIILVNVDHKYISSELEKNIERCVREQGIGLIVIGGENTFALGGYENTTLEKMLPVRCKMRGNKKQPNTGLILIIDCSGSMEDESGGVKKIEMAKEAAIKSIEILEDKDYIGVLGFSDRLEWIIPFQQIKDKEKIKYNIGKLRAKGGTLILPALKEAEKAFKRADVKIKHIILLSDGQGEREGFKEVVSNMKIQNITLSSVAVGQDAEKKLLKTVSKFTGGRSYEVVNYYEIPDIFARETYLITKKYLNNYVFVPEIVSKKDYFEKQNLPALRGYLGTGIKDGADIILQSDKEDPILAVWNYYLGKVIVWTSDLSGKWSSDWINWGEFQRQWGKIINEALNIYRYKDVKVQILQDGCKVFIYLDSGKKKEKMSAQVVIQGPEDVQKKINLKQIRLGEFQGQIVLDRLGDYVLTFHIYHGDKEVNRTVRTIYLDYSPEYDINQDINVKNILLTNFANILDENLNIFDLPITLLNKSKKSLKYLFIPLALFLFIADIWIRKN